MHLFITFIINHIHQSYYYIDDIIYIINKIKIKNSQKLMLN